MKPFVHLHNHTEYSLLDGCAKITDLVATAVSEGHTAVAITDHGNMYGAITFYTECVSKGIKPIIGCEFYITDDLRNKSASAKTSHLILIAKNNTGLVNLMKLNEVAFVDGFYYRPRIDFETLQKYAEGVICTSACIGGEIPKLILAHRYEDAKLVAQKYKDLFKDDFYLEIQNHNIEEELLTHEPLARLASELDIKLIATNDIHYIKKQDAEIQDVLMCVSMSKTLDDPTRFKFSTDEFYFKNYDEMAKMLKGYEYALDNTNEIAEKCNVTIRTKLHSELGFEEQHCLPATENYIPYYQPDNGMTTKEFLRHLVNKGLTKKYKNPTQEILDRIEYELKTIEDLGFVEYFLVVWDYINWAKENGIAVGPGRGSGAGSIVAYLSGITNIDPIKFGLIFERFIHRERVSMPDFDIDFDVEKRYDVVEYVKRKYGKENVANIIAFGKLQAKNAIKDVGRVLRIPYAETDRITKLIPNKRPDGIKKPPVLKYYFGQTGNEANDKYIIPELKEIYDNDEDLKRVVDIAIKVECFPRNTTVHACGVLIAPHPVSDYVPVAKNGEDVTTQYEMGQLEQLGLLKMDFLGLNTLNDIERAVRYVKEEKNIDINFDELGYDDKAVYELISTGNTDAIFQIESSGFKSFMKELKPTSIEDITAGVSLYRPGPMDSIPQYVKNKNNQKDIVYPHECIRDILKNTYGCIVYQEQVMQIFQVMGGYNLGQADNVRRIMGKKKVDKMELEKEKFINGWEDPKGEKSIAGAIKLGIPPEVAESVYKDMASFAQYAFNKSHAAAYSLLTYQTAYLKCYHEIEFLTAIINNRITNIDEIKKYVNYARSENIEILPPCINKSRIYFSVEKGKIRYGLSGLKGVGINAISIMLKEREANGEFKDLDDFIERLYEFGVVNKKSLESLIFSGAMDCFKLHRSQLITIYEDIINKVQKRKKNAESGQFTLFDNFKEQTIGINKTNIPNIKEYNKETLLKYEKDFMGVYMSGHPLEQFKEKFKEYNFSSDMLKPLEDEVEMDGDEEVERVYENICDGQIIKSGGVIANIKKVVIKSSNLPMAIVDIEDLNGTYATMFSPKVYETYKKLLVEDSILEICGRVSIRVGKDPIIMVQQIKPLVQAEAVEEENKQTLFLKFDTTNEDIFNKIKLILRLYSGEIPVKARCSKTGKAMLLNYKVNGNNHLLNELLGVVGEDNVVLM